MFKTLYQIMIAQEERRRNFIIATQENLASQAQLEKYHDSVKKLQIQESEALNEWQQLVGIGNSR